MDNANFTQVPNQCFKSMVFSDLSCLKIFFFYFHTTLNAEFFLVVIHVVVFRCAVRILFRRRLSTVKEPVIVSYQ